MYEERHRAVRATDGIGTNGVDIVHSEKRGFVYVRDEQIHMEVQTRGEIRHLKCQLEACDGSARIQHGEVLIRVRCI